MGAMTEPQAQPQQSGGAMSALIDLLRVLYEPDAVFGRVAQRPRFLMPFLGLVAVQIVIGVISLPFLQAAIRAQMAAAATPAPAGGPDPSSFAVIGLAFVPLGIAIALVLGAFVLWVLVSLMGGDAKFKTLLSVTAYASVPSVILLSIIGTVVLRMQGLSEITSPADMQPSLGLDLLVPASGFLGAVMKGINPFSIWGMVLTAIGIMVTHRLPKGSAYTIATITLVVGLLIAGAFGALSSRGG